MGQGREDDRRDLWPTVHVPVARYLLPELPADLANRPAHLLGLLALLDCGRWLDRLDRPRIASHVEHDGGAGDLFRAGALYLPAVHCQTTARRDQGRLSGGLRMRAKPQASSSPRFPSRLTAADPSFPRKAGS